MKKEEDLIVMPDSKDDLTNSLLSSAQSNDQLATFLMHIAANNFALGSLDFHLMSEAAERLRSYL